MTKLAIAGVAAVALITGCGDDDGGGRGNEEQEVIDALVEEGATEDEASCFVDALGADRVERFISASDDEVSVHEGSDPS